MKIDFKQPRYVLPLIALPFLCLFFYIYQSAFGKEKLVKKEQEHLQENIADVSDEVKEKSLADKMDAFRQQYRDGDGYTAVNSLDEERKPDPAIPDLYDSKEKRTLDSLERAIKSHPVAAGSRNNYSAGISNHYSGSGDDNALAEALNKVRSRQSNPSTYQQEKTEDPMAIFRKQMALIDSMGKANDPEYRQEQASLKHSELKEKEARERKALPVTKSLAPAPVFNTIKATEQENFVSAIIDQDVTAYSGSRLRIRLLEDIVAGRFVVKKGTFLFAQVSSFSAQRVNLSISSILLSNEILPVNLEIYDNDGLPGLYVPASAFREFSRELGGSSVQGVNLQQQAENNNQLVMGLLQKMFQSTSSAVAKMIRQNKARLKYNTLVYLIDPAALRNKQKNY